MKAPAFQFYPKQWLGDDKVLAMSWDARAMHMHLMCIAWQQEPPCTLPDDDRVLRQWLGNPRRWEEIKAQIFTAWKLEDGRWIQAGLLRQHERQGQYRESRKNGANARWNKDAHASPNECITDALLSSTSSSSAKQIQAPTAFVDSWNKLRGPLPSVEEFSDGRRKKVKARIAQGITIERFEAAVVACTIKPFLRGENDRGWVATFDWLVANDSNIEKAIQNPYGGTRKEKNINDCLAFDSVEFAKNRRQVADKYNSPEEIEWRKKKGLTS